MEIDKLLEEYKCAFIGVLGATNLPIHCHIDWGVAAVQSTTTTLFTLQCKAGQI